MLFDYKNIKKLYTIYNETIAIKEDGTVWHCGKEASNLFGCETLTDTTCLLFNEDEDMSQIKKVIFGYDYTAVLKVDGTVWCCGTNTDGQLGLGDIQNHMVFEKTNMTNVKDIFTSTLGYNIFVLKEDNTLWGTGYNDNGILGYYIDSSDTTIETSFIYITDNVKSVHPGPNQLFIIKNDNTIWCCGSNTNAKLGLPESVQYTGLVQYTDMTDVKDIVCSQYDTFFLKNDGSVWGSGMLTGYYILQTNSPVYGPNKLIELPNIKKIFAIYTNLYILLEDGTVYGAGVNYYGQLCVGNIEDVIGIVKTQLTGIEEIYPTSYYNYFKGIDGKLYTHNWDYDTDVVTITEESIANLTGISDINFNIEFCNGVGIMLTDDTGKYYYNFIYTDENFGQINKFYDARRTFKQIPNIKNAKEIFYTENSTQAIYILTEDGLLYSYGINYNGNLGLGDQEHRTGFELISSIDNVKSVACGNSHILVVKNDGTLWGCGSNSYGVLSLGSSVKNVTTFTQITTLGATKIKEVYAKNIFSTIIDENGAVYGCGSGYRSASGVNGNQFTFKKSTVTSGAKKVVPCSYDTFVLKEDGTVWQAGDGNTSCRGAKNVVTANLTQISELSNVIDIITDHDGDVVYFITSNNDLYVTGRVGYSQLGDIQYEENSDHMFLRPKKLTNLTESNIKKLYVCAYGNFYETNNNELWYTGVNYGFSNENLYDEQAINEPVKVLENVTIKDISMVSEGTMGYASEVYSFILTENDDLYFTGTNTFGEAGMHPLDDDYIKSSIVGLKKLELPKDFKNTTKKTIINNKVVNMNNLTIGTEHEFVIDEEGNLYARGNNEFGQLATGDNIDSFKYTKVNIDGKIEEMGCGDTHSVFLSDNKNLYAVGNNDNMQLGSSYNPDTKTPMLIMSGVKHVDAKKNLTIIKKGKEYYVAGEGNDFTEWE